MMMQICMGMFELIGIFSSFKLINRLYKISTNALALPDSAEVANASILPVASVASVRQVTNLPRTAVLAKVINWTFDSYAIWIT